MNIITGKQYLIPTMRNNIIIAMHKREQCYMHIPSKSVAWEKNSTCTYTCIHNHVLVCLIILVFFLTIEIYMIYKWHCNLYGSLCTCPIFHSLNLTGEIFFFSSPLISLITHTPTSTPGWSCQWVARRTWFLIEHKTVLLRHYKGKY